MKFQTTREKKKKKKPPWVKPQFKLKIHLFINKIVIMIFVLYSLSFFINKAVECSLGSGCHADTFWAMHFRSCGPLSLDICIFLIMKRFDSRILKILRRRERKQIITLGSALKFLKIISNFYIYIYIYWFLVNIYIVGSNNILMPRGWCARMWEEKWMR